MWRKQLHIKGGGGGGLEVEDFAPVFLFSDTLFAGN